jgi:hypothetical protein
VGRSSAVALAMGLSAPNLTANSQVSDPRPASSPVPVDAAPTTLNDGGSSTLEELCHPSSIVQDAFIACRLLQGFLELLNGTLPSVALRGNTFLKVHYNSGTINTLATANNMHAFPV